MPRLIVTPDGGPHSHDKYLDERVCGIHLDDDYSAEQLIERLAWAIQDAEKAEGALTAAPTRRGR